MNFKEVIKMTFIRMRKIRIVKITEFYDIFNFQISNKFNYNLLIYI